MDIKFLVGNLAGRIVSGKLASYWSRPNLFFEFGEMKRVAATLPQSKTPTIHLMVGGQMSGKTTLARQLKGKGAIHVDFNLFRERPDGIKIATSTVACAASLGVDVVADVNCSDSRKRGFLMGAVTSLAIGNNLEMRFQLHQPLVVWSEIERRALNTEPDEWYHQVARIRPEAVEGAVLFLDGAARSNNTAEKLLDQDNDPAILRYAEALRCRGDFYNPDGTLRWLGIPGLNPETVTLP